MQVMIKKIIKKTYKNAILIVGLPGVGNVGRVAAGHMISEMKTKKIAELYSPHFLHLVMLDNKNVTHLLKCEFHHTKIKGKDIIILSGDTQSISPEGHYKFCEKVLEYSKSIGVKDIITLGGFPQSKMPKDPRVVAAVSDEKTKKYYSKFKIDFGKDHPIGTIIGASGILLGMCNIYGMRGLCLIGETFGIPVVTDPNSADKILHVLTKILNIKIDQTKLEKNAKEMEDILKKTEDIHKNLRTDKKSKEDIRYIG